MYEWSTSLTKDHTLKKAVDCVICAMCFIQPQFFSNVLDWMGITNNVALRTASMTDDLKDSTRSDLCTTPHPVSVVRKARTFALFNEHIKQQK